MLDDEPQSLRHIEFSCIHFELEFQESVRLPRGAFLQLRRELLQVARFLDSALDEAAFTPLFDAAPPVDPVARKRIQRPGPGFVVRGIPPMEHVFELGESFELTVHFWGLATNELPHFLEILERLGQSGLSHGRGLFDVPSIAAEDASGRRHLLREAGEEKAELAPALLDARWWVENEKAVRPTAFEMNFVTPARLLSHGRPVFRPTFSAIFPFILRRVTSMTLAHCDRELFDDPGPILEAAYRLRETANTLRWSDWRRLEGQSRSQDLGGITGSLRLEGEELQEIFWILKMGSLMQIGKGAAYGSGRYDLIAEP